MAELLLDGTRQEAADAVRLPAGRSHKLTERYAGLAPEKIQACLHLSG